MKKIFFLILCVLMAVICFSTVNVFAEEVTDEIILDDFSYLNAQNWRINQKETENKVSIQTENGVLTVSSATAYAYTYYDVPIEVGADEDLIIEWDYIDSNGGDQYSLLSIMKGLRKTDDVMGFDKNAAAECVLSYINRVGESAAALNTTLGAGGPAAGDLPEAGTSYLETASWGYNFQKVDGTGDQGWSVGFETKNTRYRQVYKSDGTLEGYSAPIGEDGTVGAYTMHMLTKPGVIEYRSGYVGIYLFGNSRTEVLIDNFKAGTRAGGEEEITYVIDDDFTEADENWKDYGGTWGPELELYSYQSAASYLMFDNSAGDNYIASAPRTSVEYDRRYDGYVSLGFDMEVLSITGGRTFGVMFGLNATSDGSGVAGLPYIHVISEDSKYYACYSVTTETGYEIKEREEITEGITGVIRVELTGKTQGKVELKIGEQVIEFGQTEIKLEKRFALICKGDAAAGEIKVKIDNVLMNARYNVVSENSKSVAINFEGKDEDGNPWYNTEDWRLNSVSTGLPNGEGFQGLKIEDGALKFINAGHNSLFATEREYVNFEFQFDVVDMQRTVEVNSEGKVTKPVMNSAIIICLGMPKGGYYLQSSYIEIGSPLNKTINDADFDKATADVSLNSAVGGQMATIKNTGLRHNLLDPALDGKTIRIRVVVLDGVAKLYYCVLGEEDLNEMLYNTSVFEGKIEYPLGQVGVSVTGGSYSIGGNMTLDNIYVRDLDTDGFIETENKPVVEDPDVEVPDGGNEGEGDKTEEGGCSGNLTMTDAISLAVVPVSFASLFVVLRQVKRRNNR